MSGIFRHSRLVIVATMVALGACATGAQRQYQTIAANSKSANEQLQTCMVALYNSPETEPLRTHMPLSANDATLKQLADRSLATDQEIDALMVVHPKFGVCRKAFLSQISQTTPTLVPIYAAVLAKNEASLVELIQKKISWGEHVTRVKANAADTALQISQENKRIAAGLQQSHEAELARRQAAANAMTQYLQTQQLIDNMNRPVVTNCNQFGTMVNCVSR